MGHKFGMTDLTAAGLAIDTPLVRRLIAAQFPEWSDLEVRPIEPGGWDNRTFSLGDRMSVRLPSAGTWARGRGWTLWKALIVLAGMNPQARWRRTAP